MLDGLDGLRTNRKLLIKRSRNSLTFIAVVVVLFRRFVECVSLALKSGYLTSTSANTFLLKLEFSDVGLIRWVAYK